jgi:predicted permease
VSTGIAFAWRRIVRRPVSAVGILVTLALGIGITVSMFSVLHGIVLRALPYPDGDRVVVIHTTNLETGVERGQLTHAEAIEGLADVPGFEHTALYRFGTLTHHADGTPTSVTSVHVSGGYFPTFGLAPLHGRLLTDQDVIENQPVMVLSHAAWLSLTGGDAGAVGRNIQFKEESLELVGVLPQAFAHPSTAAFVYRPVDALEAARNMGVYRNARFVHAVGRLQPGADGLARAGLAARLAAVNAAHAMPERGWRLDYVRLVDDTVGSVRNVVYALFGVSLLVLLIACANAASLVSIRLEQRSAELAVRRSLGATAPRLAAEIGVELLLLALLAGIGGVLLAVGIIGALQPLATGNLPRAGEIGIDGVALGFAAMVAVMSALASGALPLSRALKAGPAAALRGGTSREVRGTSRVAWLPAAGVALSTLALVTALALVVSLTRLAEVDPGFKSSGVTALQITRPDTASVPGFVAQATEMLAAVPGVQEVVAVTPAPLSVVGRFEVDVTVRGRDQADAVQATARRVSGGYHRFMETPILRGRDILDSDLTGGPPVTVINQALARQAFGAADPIGEVLMLPLGGTARMPVEIVGVAADIRNAGLRAPPEPEIVVPLTLLPWVGVTLLVDSAAANAPARPFQQAIWAIDGDQAIARTYTLSEELDRQLRDARFFATATGWFAILALLLAAAGVNAVVAAMQRRRTREIGVRMALGAAPAHAARLMFGSAARIVGLGLAAGGILAYPVLNWLQGQLFGIGADHFWGLFGLTAAVLLAAGLAATCWPAWRAAHVAPMAALRHE